jgi:hypothetical protein
MPLLVDHTAPFSDFQLEVWSKHELGLAIKDVPLDGEADIDQGGCRFRNNCHT